MEKRRYESMKIIFKLMMTVNINENKILKTNKIYNINKINIVNLIIL